MIGGNEYRDGWYAHLKGMSLSANPYSLTTQAYSNADWARGWNDRAAAASRFAQELPS